MVALSIYTHASKLLLPYTHVKTNTCIRLHRQNMFLELVHAHTCHGDYRTSF